MKISDCQPASQALAKSVEALAANGGAATGSNRVLRLIRGVRHSWPQDGHPRVVVEVNPIRPGDEWVGRRLARELSRELAKLTLPSQARVASIDITPVGAEESVQCGRRGFGINVEQLNQFLRDNLTTLDFSPHTIQLFEVGLGSQRWAFLSLLYSHGPRQADVVFRPLRDELKRRFGVLLRLVASPERVGVHMATSHPSGQLTHAIGLVEEFDTGVSTHCGRFRAGRSNPRAVRYGVADWQSNRFVSVDQGTTRIFEDMMAALPVPSDDRDRPERVELRVATPLRVPGFETLSPGVTLPVIGIQAVLAPGVGSVQPAKVGIVLARNGVALDVNRASQIMFGLPAVEELNECLDEGQQTLHAQLQRIRDAARILYERDIALGTALPTQLASSRGDESGRLLFTRAESVVSSIMRFTQEQILGWRDRLEEPPALLVSRPTFHEAGGIQRLLDLALPHIDPLGNHAVWAMGLSPGVLFYPGGRLIIAQALVAGGHTKEAQSIPSLLHNAYNRRRVYLLEPRERARPGDTLPLKRGSYGFFNNQQVASASLGFPILGPELLRTALDVGDCNKTNARILREEIRRQQERLLNYLW